jgi:iron-sulfur cluster repair protein YtfE (RIC family)
MAIEFTAMEIFHHALRRDMAALSDSFDGDVWKNFAWQLHFHHVSEDRLLWPGVRAAVTDPADLALLDAMEAEHHRLDPLVAAVEETAASGDDLGPRLADLAAALEDHLGHEERAGLPLIDKVYTQADWNAYVDAVRAQTGDMAQNPAVLLPWLLRGAPDELRARVLAALPEPVRAMVKAPS